jgi:shikimate kinase/3-dehydroquinate synthase
MAQTIKEQRTMNRPIVLHGQNSEEIRMLGEALSETMGVEYREVKNAMLERLGEEFSKETPRIWGVSSTVMMNRERRIRCLNGGYVVRVGGSESWWVTDGNEEGASESENKNERVTELIDNELNEAHAVVDPGEFGIAASIEAIVKVTNRSPVVVAAGEQSYLVEVGRGNVEDELSRKNWGSPVALFVTDENVRRIHGKRLRAAVDNTGMRIAEVVLKPGEESKSLMTLGEIFDTALNAGVDRSSWVIAAGGGVVTDISGLVAAMWMRGVRWVGIPTTLLAMVDASVGGKTAVDHGMGKNAVGAFWQPKGVICDVEWLLTETDRNYVGALSEVVKTALIGDTEMFELLEDQAERVVARDLGLMEEVVRRCVQVKATIVGLDARESGVRAVLNLGHTVGHALEALGEYRKYTHGEAVSVGMVAALRLGERRGHSSRRLVERVERLLLKLGLPVELPRGELLGASELLGHDKKRAGSAIRFVFVHELGDVRTERVMLEDLREWVVGLAAQ